MVDFITRLIEKHKEYFTTKNILRMLLMMMIFFAAIYLTLHFNMSQIEDFILENQSQTIIISLLIYILFGFTFLPSIPLTIFIAVIIGPLQAAIVATIGNTIAAFFEYQIGKSMGDVVNFEKNKRKLPFGLGKLPIKSPLFMLAARSVPAGTRAFSMVCGAYEVPIPSYLWTTFTMYFLSSMFLAFGGAKLITIL